MPSDFFMERLPARRNQPVANNQQAVAVPIAEQPMAEQRARNNPPAYSAFEWAFRIFYFLVTMALFGLPGPLGIYFGNQEARPFCYLLTVGTFGLGVFSLATSKKSPYEYIYDIISAPDFGPD